MVCGIIVRTGQLNSDLFMVLSEVYKLHHESSLTKEIEKLRIIKSSPTFGQRVALYLSDLDGEGPLEALARGDGG